MQQKIKIHTDRFEGSSVRVRSRLRVDSIYIYMYTLFGPMNREIYDPELDKFYRLVSPAENAINIAALSVQPVTTQVNEDRQRDVRASCCSPML